MLADPSRTGLIFLKLGGSLITRKDRPHTARPDVLRRVAREVHSFISQQPFRRILLGHGSGSFGHVPAQKFGTRQGVHTPSDWRGFVEVWREASALDRLVIEIFLDEGLNVVAFPPSAGIIARDGRVESWDISPLRRALEVGLMPVVFGDVVFDRERGGTIFSTEDCFAHLAPALKPDQIFLAGIEPGVWKDFPASTEILPKITPNSLPGLNSFLQGSSSPDVTGGMTSKVMQSLELVRQLPELEVIIFSGEEPGSIKRALDGEAVGTVIYRD
jgi:isopentenyl phosphate kinase